MPSTFIYTEVEGQKLKLTNLEKVIYPDQGIVKAEVINYYLSIGAFMIPHLVGRPLTLIRFPDGIGKKQFYTKNKPSWTPEWMPSASVPWDDNNTYLLSNTTAHLVWLANLAGLEMHTMNSSIADINQPDNIIIDLDPSENEPFNIVKELAFTLKEFLLQHEYNPFVKTSGGKGLHLCLPIKKIYSYDDTVKAIKELMILFIKKNPGTTLNVHKEKREGKILLDIYRNHPGNTTVAPFSLRGRKGAPVSMPVSWKFLEQIDSAKHFNIHNALQHINENGDAWQNIYDHATILHNQKTGIAVSGLEAYEEKRNFKLTEEPKPNVDPEVNGKYVIQLHDASNLHYDLRLGIDGVLKSWAIPKGLPTEESVKRLAIQTEDHPAKYLHFEGIIPQEEYGGGEMWVFETGKMKLSSRSSSSIKFTLSTIDSETDFHLYRIKEKEWIIERESNFRSNLLKRVFKPMLSGVSKAIPKNKDKYQYEIKWDGIRVLLYKKNETIRIISRSGRDITKNFPEFTTMDFLKVEECVIDGELVCLDNIGRPVFSDIISRMHTTGTQKINQLSQSRKAYMYCFDCLHIDGQDIMKSRLERRREYLKAILKTGDRMRMSDTFDDGDQLFTHAREMQLEGIMAKKKGGLYYQGTRSDVWMKIKFRETLNARIIGYTKGKGDRVNVFGSLHLADYSDDEIRYLGKVGTGFSTGLMKEILLELKKLDSVTKPIKERIDEERKAYGSHLIYIVK